MTEEEICEFLSKRAQIPTKDGPAAEELAARTARKIFQHVDNPFRILRLLREVWFPRWKCSWDDDKLFHIIDRVEKELAAATAQAEQTARDARMKAAAAAYKERAARHAAEEARRAAEKETQATKIAKLLGCRLRNAYTIINEGTTVAEHAAKLAKEFDTFPQAWLREPCRRGRRTRIVELLTKLYLPGCTLRHYVDSEPNLEGGAGELSETLHAKYLSGHVTQAHFATFDEFRKHATYVGFGVEAAADFWDAYLIWRLPKVFDLADAELWG